MLIFHRKFEILTDSCNISFDLKIFILPVCHFGFKRSLKTENVFKNELRDKLILDLL